MAKVRSSQSLCALQVRNDLKVAFPSVKFSVTSKGFSGGDSVHISWADGPCASKVKTLISKYQYGHFDGMTDMYEFSNVKSIPQVKYLQYRRYVSDVVNEQVISKFEADYGIDRDDSKAWMDKTHQWLSQLVWRKTSEWSEGETL